MSREEKYKKGETPTTKRVVDFAMKEVMKEVRLPKVVRDCKIEVWRNIPNFNGYQASNLGEIRSVDRVIENKANKSGLARVKGKVLKQATNVSSGYKFVNLSGKVITIHQLIAITFLGHKPNGYKLVVDHIDNDRTNNVVKNLRVVTARENCSKRTVAGSSKYVGVHWCRFRGVWRSSIRINGKKVELGAFDCELEASKAYQDKLKTIINEC